MSDFATNDDMNSTRKFFLTYLRVIYNQCSTLFGYKSTNYQLSLDHETLPIFNKQVERGVRELYCMDLSLKIIIEISNR